MVLRSVEPDAIVFAELSVRYLPVIRGILDTPCRPTDKLYKTSSAVRLNVSVTRSASPVVTCKYQISRMAPDVDRDVANSTSKHFLPLSNPVDLETKIFQRGLDNEGPPFSSDLTRWEAQAEGE